MTSDNVHNLHKPNRGMIREHLERLFHRARVDYPDCRCEIAWTDARGQITSGNTFLVTPEGLDLAAAEGVMRNEGGVNVYVAVNPHKPDRPPFGRGDAKDVQCAYFQFADIDKAEGIERLRQPLPIPYTMAVTTGRTPGPRVHPYWELEEPTENLEAWRRQQMALRDYFQGDAVIDPPRVMRLAGTVNFPNAKKAGNGYLIEPVTLRTVYDDERSPVSSEAMCHAYPWAQAEYAYSEFGDRAESAGPQPQPGSSDRFDTGRKDPREYVRNIAAGHNLHNNARDLISHLVNTGHRDWLIRELMDRLLRPVSDGGTLGQIDELIRSARQKFNTAEPGPEVETEDFSAPPPATEPLAATPVSILDPKARKPREWLVRYRMMRGHVTMTTAPPGVGKSTLAVEEAVSMAAGIDFLGFGITEPLRVLVVNNEETRDELERRIEATCQHFGIAFDTIAERLLLYSGVDNPKLVLVRTDRHGGFVVATEQWKQLRFLIEAEHLDAVILDPFVHFHYVAESSNEEISQALRELRALGLGECRAAIHVIHHSRKPAAGNSHQAGDMNSARGASSMGGDAHFFFTLTDMSPEDAEKLNIPEHDRVNFLRLDDAKRKMAPAQSAKWFERYGEMMPYGLIGEEVGVLVPVDQRDLDNTEISSWTATAILKKIDEAWKEGAPYSQHARATKRYVVNMIMHEFNMTRPTAKALLKDWLENGMVITEMCDTHANLQGLRVAKWPG
jgi:hypothetical protein